MKTRHLPLLMLALVAAPLALAHDEATLDAMKAPNGGQLRMAGNYHYELVVQKDADGKKAAPLVVHVTDHGGTAQKTAGATGKATVLAGKSKAVIDLKPDGENRMQGSGAYLAAPDMKVVVSITLPGLPAEQARFTPGHMMDGHMMDGHAH